MSVEKLNVLWQDNNVAEGSVGKVLVEINGQPTLRQATIIRGVLSIIAKTETPCYVGVSPYDVRANFLQLGHNDTLKAMKEGSVIIYRSSGEKDGDRTLTRAEQEKNGTALKYVIVAKYKGGEFGSKDNPFSYDWSIKEAPSNVKVIAEGK